MISKSLWPKTSVKQNIQNGNLISIPDFCFPYSTSLTKETSDGKYLISIGTYPSQVKCFSLNNLNMKFQRNFDSDIIDFQVLTRNWEKLTFLRSDRKLDFHTKSGLYYQIKLPEKGCDLTFDRRKLVLYIPGVSNKVAILDLNNGKFTNEIKSDENSTITCSGVNNKNGLFVTGMENGKNEFWDPRILKKCIGKLNNFNYLKYKKYNSVSSLRFNDKNDNLFFSGFHSGEVVVYDLRCFSPLISKVIHPLNPVKTIRANYNSNYILVSDSNFVKYWRLSTGKTKISFKSEININHICSIKNTGIIFFSLNYKNIGIKYFKSLGPLPEWSCALE